VIPDYDQMARRIEDEVGDLERVVARARRSWDKTLLAAADQDIFVDSTALNLHGFYSGIERLFEIIARRVDGGLPEGEAWHQVLLQQMAEDRPSVRPTVISQETVRDLDDLRRFRHLVRNVYAEHLDPQRMTQLMARLPILWARLAPELLAFSQFLRSVSAADEAVK